MVRLSDLIEAFIKEMIDVTNGVVEIRRNELANRFKCVPSQINYVIGTRFTIERGYYVESRRGGGGYIRIQRAKMHVPGNYLMHIIASMGNSLSQQSAGAFVNNFIDYNVVSIREGQILKAATSDKVLVAVKLPERDYFRAAIFKNMLMSLIV